MAGPLKGALGATFTVTRALEGVCLIAIIGMTANFIAEMVSANITPPTVLIATLGITCIACLYCAISWILYVDNILPMLIACGLDCALLIAVIVVACTTGKPLSYLNCAALPSSGGNTYGFMASVGENMLSKVDYWIWAGASSATCYEMKSIWGLSIALCILFAVSSIVSVFIWKRNKAVLPRKDIEH